jgi:hypothetical protein
MIRCITPALAMTELMTKQFCGKLVTLYVTYFTLKSKQTNLLSILGEFSSMFISLSMESTCFKSNTHSCVVELFIKLLVMALASAASVCHCH